MALVRTRIGEQCMARMGQDSQITTETTWQLLATTQDEPTMVKLMGVEDAEQIEVDHEGHISRWTTSLRPKLDLSVETRYTMTVPWLDRRNMQAQLERKTQADFRMDISVKRIIKMVQHIVFDIYLL